MVVLINFIAFQIGWFACILGAARNQTFWGPAVVALVLLLHFSQSRARAAEAVLAIAAGCIGFIVDTTLISLGAFVPVREILPHPLSTFWLMALWVNFATTLNVSMNWLNEKYLLAAVFGALGGPMAYLAGDRLNAIEIARPLLVPLFTVGLAWGIVTPALFRIARWARESRLSRRT